MVLGASYSSLRGFAISRPPLLVFTLCLTAFALTTLWLAYYVRNVDDLQNIDAHRDWQSLLSFLSHQGLCIQPSSATVKSYVKNVSEVVTVNVLAVMNLAAVPSNISYVHGYLPISEWKSLCPPYEKQTAQLEVSFSLKQIVNNSSPVCVSITGPRGVLIMADSPPACSSTPLLTTSSLGILTGRSSPPSLGERVDRWCQNGTSFKLDYKINAENSVILNLNDRSIINLHLIHTSYFLFIMAITLICYAVLRGGKSKNKLSLDKVPLDL